MSILRMMTWLGASALGATIGFCGFIAVVLSWREVDAMNEVFAAGYGAAHLLPTAALALTVGLLPTVLLARYSASLALALGLSSVLVFSLLLTVLSYDWAWSVAGIGAAIAIVGTILVVVAVRSVRGGAV